MKKLLSNLFLISMLILIFSSCAKEKNIVFNATVEDINGNSLMVSTINFEGFDKASVGITADTVFVETTLSEIKIGDTVEIIILPQIRESYPVQVTAVKISSLKTDVIFP